jgi:membrane-associated PAP2 superfamily phosphatase
MRHPAPLTPLLATTTLGLWTLSCALVILAWDASGLDLWLASLSGNAQGFPLQNHWFWKGVMHERVRQIHWLPALALAVGVFLPFGGLRGLPRARRIQLAVGPLVAIALISSLKMASHTSCPWDMQQFGGSAQFVSHWSRLLDGGRGNCFPAGHASAGFAYLTGFFVFRRMAPGTARAWLLGSVAVGVALGLAQQLRGAHFLSHTLWTAWLCWVSALLVDLCVTRWASQKPSLGPALAPGSAAAAP